ncbi:hypothetical protein L3X38_027779 [Prunus dulcis]|uniref:Uncharacterized protein n=1 Tax=Prunus dulcis TaxID=3755 RepID=A0AAD4VR70_PRUDU|nr:hypothetical protein L3X38_027779 [Prunus dulcis]
MHNRSVSEPDFGRTPRQVDSSKERLHLMPKEKPQGVLLAFARFGFGSQLLQKTVGLVLRPRPGNRLSWVKTNKFYYAKKLKDMVEEGVEPPAEEAALPPPPTTTAFHNVKPAVAANAKFFIPTLGSSSEQTMEAIAESVQEDVATKDVPSTSARNDPFQTPLCPHLQRPCKVEL